VATKLEFLVAKLKVVLALATVSIAISSPGKVDLLEDKLTSLGFAVDYCSNVKPQIKLAL